MGLKVSAQRPNPQVGLRIGGNKNPNSLCEGDTITLINLTRDSAKTVDYYIFHFNWRPSPLYPVITDTLRTKDSVSHSYVFHDSVALNSCNRKNVELYVGLTAVDTWGDKYNITSNIKLFLRPRLRFSMPSKACVGDTVAMKNFTCPNDSNNFTYKWLVENKSFSTKDLAYAFSKAGKHKVKLIVNSGNPCSLEDTLEKEITIYPYPTAKLDIQKLRKKNTFCFGKDTVKLFNLSSNYTHIKWTITPSDSASVRFLDTPFINADTVRFIPLKTGRFRVKLTAYNNICWDTTNTQIFDVIVSPEVKLRPLDYCLDSTYIEFSRLIDTSNGLTDKYFWKLSGPSKADSSTINFPGSIGPLAYGEYVFEFRAIGICDTFINKDTFFIAPAINKTADTVILCNSKDTSVRLIDMFSGAPKNFGQKWTPDSILINSAFKSLGRDSGVYVFYLRDSNSSCYSDSIHIKVLHSNPPNVDDVVACISQSAVSLSSPISGGSFKGKGISGRTFYPASAGIGTHKIIYTSPKSIDCPFSDTFQIEVMDTSAASFTIDTVGCTGVPIRYTNTSTNKTYKWFFGNGSSSTNDSGTITYSRAGTYTVKLITGAKGGCLDSTELKVRIFSKPQMTPVYTVDSSNCDSVTISFQISNPDSTLSYSWTVGNDTFSGTKGTATVPKLPRQDDSLHFAVAAKGLCGTIGDSGIVRIPPKAFADINTNGPLKSCTPFLVSFSRSGYGSPDSFRVDYGNGQSSRNSLRQITYTNNTSTDTQYQVVITAFFGNCTASTDTLTITVAPNNINPNFSISDPGCKDSIVDFRNNSRDSVSLWVFGDGQRDSGQSTHHKYSQTGNYDIQIYYSALWGCKDTAYAEIRIIDPPKIRYQYSIDSALCDTTRLFVEVLNPDTLFKYVWYVGGRALSIKPIDTISIAEKYYKYTEYLELRSENKCGNEDLLDSFIMYPGFKADVVLDGLNIGCSPFKPILDNHSTGDVEYFDIDYGNGDTSINRVKQVEFRNNTDSIVHYEVVLRAFNSACGTLYDTLRVFVKPNTVRAYAQYSDTSLCTAEVVTFINNSSPDAYVWVDWGDSSFSMDLKFGDTVQHTYSIEGQYTVHFFAESCGFDTSAKYSILVSPKPNLSFNIKPAGTCVGQPITFTNSGDSTFVNYWRLNGKDTAYRQTQFTKVFGNSGTYRIELIGASVKGGCADSIHRDLDVDPQPIMNISINDPVGCVPHRVCASISGNMQFVTIDWGNGEFGSLVDSCTTYSASDTLLVMFNGSTINGCKMKDSSFIYIEPYTSADYLLEVDTTPCDHVILSGRILSTEPQLSYSWRIGTKVIDSSRFSIQVSKDVMRYLEIVELTVRNSCRVETYFDTVEITPSWEAQIGISGPSKGCTPFTPNFINHTRSYIDSFRVDYGNGKQSVNTFTPITYINNSDTPQTYTVTLTIFNSYCSPSVDTAEITVLPNTVKLGVEYSDVNYCESDTISFINRSSPGAHLTFYFGDGSSITDEFEFGDTIRHIYMESGTYSISVATRNECLGDSIRLMDVNILKRPSLSFKLSSDPVCQGSELVIENTSDNVSNILWILDMIDTFRTNQRVNFTFKDTGTHTIFLQASSTETGCIDSLREQIQVRPKLTHRVELDTPICVGAQTCIRVTGNVTKCYINWGNGQFGSITDTCVTYRSSGNFDVALELKTREGCSLSETYAVQVYPEPSVMIIPDLEVMNLGIGEVTNLTFNKQPYSSYHWLMNGDTLCSSLNPKCDSIEVGPFSSTTVESYALLLVDPYGCIGSDEIKIRNWSKEPFYVPNSFTPNYDGTNETFRPIIFDKTITSYDMIIFNRWGEILFKEYELMLDFSGWNGIYKGEMCETEVYGVYIKFHSTHVIEGKTYKGYVYLLK